MQLVAGTDESGVELSNDSVEVEKIDDLTVKMNLKRPMTDAIFFQQSQYFYIVPEHLLKDTTPETFMEADFWNSPIGNGRHLCFRYPKGKIHGMDHARPASSNQAKFYFLSHLSTPF